MSQKFENLEVWKKAKDLAIQTYKLTGKYPQREQFAITSQTTRAVVSISCNIAEGTSRPSQKDFRHFLNIAIGSAFELENLIILAYELGYITIDEKEEIITNITIIEKMINGLRRSLND